MDASIFYTGMFDALAMALLLSIIVAFYVSLTLEAFKGVVEGQAATGPSRRGRAGMDCRLDEDGIRRPGGPVRRRRAF